MDPERFQKVRELFSAALERESDDRGAFVFEASQGDAELSAEVLLLLEAHDRTITLRQSDPRRAPAASDSRTGRRLGDYEIVRSIGRGGMGTVYLARRADDAFHKLVAIKILRADSSTSDLLNRFQREREILAQLEHPNIARLLDAGETDDGLPYFVMEYVEGRAITDYADDLRLTMRDRIELFRQVCNAVEYAHQHKIVHRDLKPGNILVTAEGQVKLLDFGIARLVRQDAGAPALTQTGLWLMTPEYASPEQVRGEPVARTSDVYSLGIILFELLTGHRPYHLRSRVFHEIVRVICEESPTRPSVVIAEPVETISADGKLSTFPPDTAGKLRQTSLDELRRDLSGDIDNILLKTLDKDAAERYDSCRDLEQDLRRHLEGLSVSAEGASHWYPAGKFISRYRWWVAAALVLLIATATGAVQVSPIFASMALGLLWVLVARYRTTRREFGERVASQTTFGMFLLLAAASMTWPAIKILGFNLSAVSAIFSGTFFVYNFFLLARWLTRQRWAGAVLLRTGRPKSGNTAFMMGLSVLGLTVSLPFLLVDGVSGERLNQWLFVPFIASMLAFRAALEGKIEVRDHGILAEGGYWPWGSINSYTWLPTASDTAVLVLKIKRRSRLLAALRDLLPLGGIQVPIGDKGQFEVILDRQLGEWPHSHSAPEGVQDSVNLELPAQNRTAVRRFELFAGLVVALVCPALIYYSARGRQTASPPVNAPQIATNPQAEQFGRIALNAISQFHNDFSDGRYDSACRSVDQKAMRGITGLPCAEFLAWAHTKLGKVETSEQVIRAVGPVGAEMDGTIDCLTRFEHGAATEHFEWRLSAGRATLKWYRIESSELSK